MPHQFFRGAGAGGEADHLLALHPFGLQFAAVIDQIGRHAFLDADLAQAVGIGAVGRAHHQDHIGDLGQLAHRGLAVLGGIADVAGFRADDVAEALLQRGDDALGVVDRKRGLGDIGDRRRRRDVQGRDIGLMLHQGHRRADLAHGAFHFGMAGMADQDQACGHGRHSACPDCAPWKPAGRWRPAPAARGPGRS